MASKNQDAIGRSISVEKRQTLVSSKVELPEPGGSGTLKKGASASARKSPEPKRPKVEETKKSKPVKKVLLEHLLNGVVFSISGIQNPERADIRQNGLALGAKYRPDWGQGCTHLICAYANTPKYSQVKGKGKIVKKHWFRDCLQQRKRLSWRK